MKLMQQKNFKKIFEADDSIGLSLPKFLKVAKSFGFNTKKFTNENNLNQNLDKVIQSKQLVICGIITPSMQELVLRVQI
tara:strand:+ start:237 stop:473 length:237 start_codon:yes stop_codon:yes gene_type:complete